MDLLQLLREPLAQVGGLNAFALSGGLIGFLVFIPLCMSILKGTAEQNLATFILWGLLDGLAAVSTIVASGNYLLPALYTLGSVAVVTCIVMRTPKIQFTWLEGFCAAMVVLCILTWMNWDSLSFMAIPLSAEQMVVVLSSTALVIAGIPLLWDAIKKPGTSAPLTYLGYTTANVLSTFAGSSWAVEERFYAGSAAAFTLLVFLAGSRRWLTQRNSVLAH